MPNQSITKQAKQLAAAAVARVQEDQFPRDRAPGRPTTAELEAAVRKVAEEVVDDNMGLDVAEVVVWTRASHVYPEVRVRVKGATAGAGSDSQEFKDLAETMISYLEAAGYPGYILGFLSVIGFNLDFPEHPIDGVSAEN